MNEQHCTSCGVPLGENDRFCGSCGAPTPATAPGGTPTPTPAGTPPPTAAPAGAPAQAPPPTRGRAVRTGLMIGLGAAVPILIGLAVYVLVANGDDEAATTTDGTIALTPTVAPASTTLAATSATAPAMTVPATTGSAPATTPPATSPPTSAAPTTTSTTTVPQAIAPPREPIDLPIGQRGACQIAVGTGGRLADLSSGRATGFDVAVAAELVQRVWGYDNVCFVDVAAADRFEVLNADQIAILVRSTAATVSRGQLAEHTSAYLLDGLAVAVRESAGPTAALTGLRIGTLTGTPAAELLRQGTDAAAVVESPNLNSLLDDFETEALDGIVFDWTYLHPRYADFPGIDVFHLGLTNEPLAVFTPKGRTARIENVQAALDEMIADGTWTQIFIAEFGSEPWYDPATLATYEPLAN